MVAEKDVIVQFRASSTLKDSIEAAAEKSGLASAEWMRAVLARAANEGAFTPRKGERHGKRKSARK